ncbi:MAG: HDOD domain-containing protein [Deltaproteobacteria bacterium]|nr:HDOD domain-containing protein [Deltaproteobacteria bacterium]
MPPQFLLARQPIFNRNMDTVAYELLFRSAEGESFESFLDGDQATSKVIRHTFMDGTASRVVGPYPAHINVTAHLFRADIARLLPREQVVLEFSEYANVDTELFLTLQDLAQDGYRIALDHFEWRPEHNRLLDIASVVKLDVIDLSWEQVERQLDVLSAFPVDVLAERVESHELFQKSVDAGFHLFQGYFLCRPAPIKGRSIATSRLTVMQLLQKVYDPDVRIDTLEKIIRRDVGLSYRLLRIINSAYYALPRKVESIHEALVLLGLHFVRQWVSVLAMAGFEDKPNELFRLAMVRARMAENLARAIRRKDTEPFFVVGLFSVLDAALDRPLPTILKDLPLSQDVMNALLHRTGVPGEALDCVIAHERGQWNRVKFQDIPEDVIQQAYLQAVEWSGTTQQLLAD